MLVPKNKRPPIEDDTKPTLTEQEEQALFDELMGIPPVQALSDDDNALYAHTGKQVIAKVRETSLAAQMAELLYAAGTETLDQLYADGILSAKMLNEFHDAGGAM